MGSELQEESYLRSLGRCGTGRLKCKGLVLLEEPLALVDASRQCAAPRLMLVLVH